MIQVYDLHWTSAEDSNFSFSKSYKRYTVLPKEEKEVEEEEM